MNIIEIYGLPFISMTVVFRGRELQLEKVLLDTGSASTLLNADIVREIGMVPEGNDIVDIIVVPAELWLCTFTPRLHMEYH